jgi:hypothetical protein
VSTVNCAKLFQLKDMRILFENFHGIYFDYKATQMRVGCNVTAENRIAIDFCISKVLTTTNAGSQWFADY